MRPRTETKEKKLADDAQMLRAWRRWHQEQVKVLLAGPHGEELQALIDFLKAMTTPTALVNFVKAGPWRDADAEVRAEILTIVSTAITQRREQIGLAPFDDPLPGEPLNAFLILREELNHFRLMAAPPGAKPGLINEPPQIREKQNVE